MLQEWKADFFIKQAFTGFDGGKRVALIPQASSTRQVPASGLRAPKPTFEYLKAAGFVKVQDGLMGTYYAATENEKTIEIVEAFQKAAEKYEELTAKSGKVRKNQSPSERAASSIFKYITATNKRRGKYVSAMLASKALNGKMTRAAFVDMLETAEGSDLRAIACFVRNEAAKDEVRERIVAKFGADPQETIV